MADETDGPRDGAGAAPAVGGGHADQPPPIVGIGASAGGIAALQELVEHLPSDSGIAWVLIQHMAPDRPSELSAILARRTELPVLEVTEDTGSSPTGSTSSRRAG